MRVNKFGTPLERRDDNDERAESARNFVRNTALCLSSASEYDARERAIRRLAEPKSHSDAATRNYADGVLERAQRIVTETVEALRKDTNARVVALENAVLEKARGMVREAVQTTTELLETLRKDSNVSLDALRKDTKTSLDALRSEANARVEALENVVQVLRVNSVSLIDHKDYMLKQLAKLTELAENSLPRRIEEVERSLSAPLSDVRDTADVLRKSVEDSIQIMQKSSYFMDGEFRALRDTVTKLVEKSKSEREGAI